MPSMHHMLFKPQSLSSKPCAAGVVSGNTITATAAYAANVYGCKCRQFILIQHQTIPPTCIAVRCWRHSWQQFVARHHFSELSTTSLHVGTVRVRFIEAIYIIYILLYIDYILYQVAAAVTAAMIPIERLRANRCSTAAMLGCWRPKVTMLSPAEWTATCHAAVLKSTATETAIG